jgi:hypothetical protein
MAKIGKFGRQPRPGSIGPKKSSCRAKHNRKRPAGEAGRFWGYYREER